MNDKLAVELQNEIREIHQKVDKVSSLTYKNSKQIALVIKHQEYQNGGLGDAVSEFKKYCSRNEEDRKEERKALVVKEANFADKIAKQQKIITDLKIKVYGGMVMVIGALGIFIYNWAVKGGLL